jgi:hypothetical protein
MSSDDAIARFRARWAHPTLDPRDVLERVAIRFDGEGERYSVVPTPPAVRLFRLCRPAQDDTPAVFRSAYVHSTREVDAAIDLLEAA